MKHIQLSKSQTAIVDDEDFEELNKVKWTAGFTPKTNSYYAFRMIQLENGKRKKIYMHRLIMGVTERTTQVDHIFHLTLDNRKSELRICTHSQNQQNRKKQKGPFTSQYKGIFWRKSSKMWRISIHSNGITYRLGYHSSEIEAAKIYNEAALHYNGPYAMLNIIS